MSNENAVALRDESALTTSMVKPGEIMQIINHVHSVIKDAMTEGIDNDYGIIPGTKKKTLLKPGAEKLLLAFGLTAVARSPLIVDMPNGHREITIETEIIHMSTNAVLAIGLGSCSTMEGKYRYRNADIVCPDCGATTIIKGKQEFGGGWICYGKKGGCGKKWTDKESPFTGAMNNKAEHDNPADYYNTVLKMASKRSMVDGAIRATASSAMFTQDVEDLPGKVSSTETDKKAPSGDSKKSPEQSKASGPTNDKPASGPQIKAIQAMLSKLKVTDDLERHVKVSEIIGSPDTIASFKELTVSQASAVIERLNEELAI